MRVRYRRYANQARSVATSGFFADTTNWEQLLQQRSSAATPSSAQYERKRLAVPRPAIDPHQAGQDLADALADVEDHLGALRDAGLAAVSEPIAVLLEDLRAVTDYSRTVLDGYGSLHQHADELTGDLDEAQRVQRAMAAEQDRLGRALDEARGTIVNLRAEAQFSYALQKVLYEAEKRGTVKRGTVKRWLAAARESLKR